MKRGLLSLLILALLSLFATFSYSAPQSFSNISYRSIHEIWRQLHYFGLLEMNPWDPNLPRPQVSALKAVVSRRAGLLVYYDEEMAFGESTLLFKNPNGGYRHSVSFTRDAIQFVTPYQGTVAHANQFMTVNGPGFNYYCQSRWVSEQGFYQCIDRLFVQVIVDQLKRYVR
jgi:hypothetical protein